MEVTAPIMKQENMSTDSKKEPNAQQEESSGAPAFEILYCDVGRVGTCLTQLHGFGESNADSQPCEATRGHEPLPRPKPAMSFTGGRASHQRPKVAFAFGQGEQEAVRQASESGYAAVWVDALNFKELLEDGGKLGKDIGAATAGSFVFLRGELFIYDVSAKKAWLNDLVTQRLMGNVYRDAGADGPKNQTLGFELLAKSPHSIHCSIGFGETEAWGPLQAESLSSRIEDIGRTHGVAMPGEWEMIAILDARRNTEPEFDSFAPTFTDTPESELYHTVLGLSNIVRTVLGRPAGAYGVTPILISRPSPRC